MNKRTIRQRINDRFQAAAAALSPPEQQLLKAEMTRCFLKLLTMAADLAGKTAKNIHPFF